MEFNLNSYNFPEVYKNGNIFMIRSLISNCVKIVKCSPHQNFEGHLMRFLAQTIYLLATSTRNQYPYHVGKSKDITDGKFKWVFQLFTSRARMV